MPETVYSPPLVLRPAAGLLDPGPGPGPEAYDAAGLELGRVRASIAFHDTELGPWAHLDERDVELTEGVMLLVRMGLLLLLETYPDPSVDDV